MIEFPVTSASISAVLAFLFSLFFSYFPVVRVKWAALTAEKKSLITIGLTLAISVAVYLLGCYGIIHTGITCDQGGVVSLVLIFITTLTTGQSTWTITKNLPAPDVSVVKANPIPSVPMQAGNQPE